MRLAVPMLLVLACSIPLAAPADRTPPWASPRRVTELSPEAQDDASGASPGGAAAYTRIQRLTKTTDGALDGRLVVVYQDATTESTVWESRGGAHQVRDVFVRHSDDDGATWSVPINLSRSAGLYSAITDGDGDGVSEPYWGDNSKPVLMTKGDVVVVAWTSRYVPEPGWSRGQVGVSSLQGSSVFDADGVAHEVPYHGVFAAVSPDGGGTWTHGGEAPALQLTYGRRDAHFLSHRGQGKRWTMVWQEDPAGLQPGEAEGPGEGSSGAKTSSGTDIWYAFTDNVVTKGSRLAATRTPVSDNSTYDATAIDWVRLDQDKRGGAGGPDDTGPPDDTAGPPDQIPPEGDDGCGDDEPGEHEPGQGPPDDTGPGSGGCGDDETDDGEGAAASRPMLMMVQEHGSSTALVAYEETKALGITGSGKVIRYHAFPYDAPGTAGAQDALRGEPGTPLTPQDANARRVRMVVQTPDGVAPALAIFWRQGAGSQGAPADILLKTSTSTAPAAVLAAPAVNLSSGTPHATSANLQDATERDAYENARAHRALLNGSFLVVGYCYTRDAMLAQYTDLVNYDFWVRRSFDGGRTWLAPQNLSQLPANLTVAEPRLVAPQKTGTQDTDAFVSTWSAETNVCEGRATDVLSEIWLTRTADCGETFSPPVCMTDDAADYDGESQLQVSDDVRDIYAVWLRKDVGTSDAAFRRTQVLPDNVVFQIGDRLVGELGPDHPETRATFFGVNGCRVTFSFPPPRKGLRLGLEISDDDGRKVGTWTVDPDPRSVPVRVRLRNTSLYTVRMFAQDGTAGSVDVHTSLRSRDLARKGRVRTRARAGVASLTLAALPGAELTALARSPGQRGASLVVTLLGPDGVPIDAAHYTERVLSGGVQLTGVPLADGGLYVLNVSGLPRGRATVRIDLSIEQPAVVGRELELP